MEKVRVTINGHDFNLKSDDPARIYAAAEELKKKISQINTAAAGMSFSDTVILSALDIADEAQDAKDAAQSAERTCEEYEKQLAELDAKLKNYEKNADEKDTASEKLELANGRIAKLESENNELIAENDKLIADTKSLREENDELSAKNKALESKLAQLETSWNSLKKDFARSHNKMSDVSGANEQEIAVLKETVATYEKTFDGYVKQKTAELTELNDELNALRKKYADLNQQMSEIVNDGQLTL